MADRNEEIKEMATASVNDDSQLMLMVDQLSGSSRRERQFAAAVIAQVTAINPELVVPHVNALIDALNRPEAQTRWECLEALAVLVDYDSRACNKAIPEADAALFDEESGPVRLAAMRFLCKLGSTTSARSEKCWPLIDEGIQCYHGDLEFGDMLTAINDFSKGKLSEDVKEELKSRMSFDALNGKGSLKRRSQQIIDNLG